MRTESNCRGLSGRQIRRRAFLQTTLSAGMAGLTLPNMLRAQAAAREYGGPEAVAAGADTAVIQIWLGG